MDNAVAIVGIAARVPGARNSAEFWERTKNGDICLTALPVRGTEIGARGLLDDADAFDADLFEFADPEAAALDPQHRVFLELCWHALEDAGVDPFQTHEAVALYATCSTPNVPTVITSSVVDEYQRLLAWSPDFLATRVSHRLNLRGESIVVQTGCSSSLVAVHLACQSLLTGQCDVALAGGISIAGDQSRGYVYEEGMIASPDGRCRPFDTHAAGTVPGSGGSVVALKVLDEARQNGDHIYAVVIGSAINNDGRLKASFMAPSVAGQAEVIATALAAAGVEPSTIGLVEAHGTATPLGDAIEVEALRRAFAGSVGRTVLSSVKGSIGHLDRAAGVVGLVRAALSLHHETLPPAPGSEAPNKTLRLETSPFHLPQQASPWPRSATPRRAGVSSFGVGGTNAHVVLEEAPDQPRSAIRLSGSPQLVTLSARSHGALDTMRVELADWLEREDDALSLESVAAARNLGRSALDVRLVAVARDPEGLVRSLHAAGDGTRAERSGLALMFQGHGSGVPRGGDLLSKWSDAYRSAVDECAAELTLRLGLDIRDVLSGATPAMLTRMEIAQPALFTLEYALARMWLTWVTPDVLLGHSMGELAAATVAGVFELPEALHLVAERGRLLDASGDGLMLSVAVSEESLAQILPNDVDLAAVNAPTLCVVSGATASVSRFEDDLERRGIPCRRLRIGCAAHSRLMDPYLEELRAVLDRLTLRPPATPLVSTLTGSVADDRVVTVEYWVDQYRRPVRFADAVAASIAGGHSVMLEIGPGSTLTRLAEQQLTTSGHCIAIPSLVGDDEEACILEALGRAWCAGCDVDWTTLHPRRETPWPRLPLYPFERARRWPTETNRASVQPQVRPAAPHQWLYEHDWEPTPLPAQRFRPASERTYVIVGGPEELATRLTDALHEHGSAVVRVMHDVSIIGRDGPPDAIVLLEPTAAAGASDLKRAFWNPLGILRELASNPSTRRTRIWAVTRGLWCVDGDGGTTAASPLVALERVGPQEIPALEWTTVDLPDDSVGDSVVAALAEEFRSDVSVSRVALRTSGRFTETLRPAWPMLHGRSIRDGGTYVVTGAFGRVGRTIVEAIADNATAVNLVLIGRTAQEDRWVERLRDTAASCHIAVLDVTDADAVRALIREVVERTGRIDGVVHAAGHTDRERFPTLLDATEEIVNEILAAKVGGTLALAAALEGQRPDFVLLCSSLSTTFGGIRYGPYVAANAFLDAFAASRSAHGDTIWMSLAWEAWLPANDIRGSGMLAELALDSREGRETFVRALAVAGPKVTVSTLNPDLRRSVIADTLTAADPRPGVEAVDNSASASVIVREAVRRVVGRDPLHDTQDLRELGVDSLGLLQITASVGRRLGIAIPVAAAFRAPSIASLTAICTADSAPADDLPRLRRAPDVSEHPTTTLQRRWLEVAASDFGYIDLFVRFDASVDVSRLRQSLDTVLRRHSALRTRFPDAQTQLVERTPVSVDVVDGHTGSALRRELRERAQYRYDFVREVPLQLLLARETSGSVLLHLHVHHILFDGTSSSVFFRDLAAVYEQRSLAPPSFQYVDFAVWQAAYVQSSSFRETRQYWQARFAGASGPLLIASEFANNSCDVTGDRECLELRGDWVQRIRAAARLHDATPFTLFTAAYLRLLGEITGQRDVVIGTTAAGRPVHDAAEIVGVFVNPLPVRFCLDAHDDDDALIAEVRRRLVEFHEHQAYWVEDLVTHVDPFIGAKLNDVFSTYILLQNYWRPRPLIGTVRYAPVHVEGVVEHRLMRDVELVINESTNGWTLELWYRRANHSRESATTWLRRFEELATDLVDTRRKVSR